MIDKVFLDTLPFWSNNSATLTEKISPSAFRYKLLKFILHHPKIIKDNNNNLFSLERHPFIVAFSWGQGDVMIPGSSGLSMSNALWNSFPALSRKPRATRNFAWRRAMINDLSVELERSFSTPSVKLKYSPRLQSFKRPVCSGDKPSSRNI